MWQLGYSATHGAPQRTQLLDTKCFAKTRHSVPCGIRTPDRFSLVLVGLTPPGTPYGVLILH